MYPNRPTRSAQGPRRRGFLAPLGTVVALVLLAANPGLVFAWNSLAFSSTEEDHMITLTNQARAANGKGALIEDATLRSVAEQRAKYIYDNSWAQHTQLDGKTAFTILKGLGYCYLAAAENLGTNNYSDSTATQVMFDWFMGSSGHRANILGPYDHIGIGAYKGNNSASSFYHVYVMIFADNCGSSTPKPTRRPTPKPATSTPQPAPTATPVATPEPTPTPEPRDPAEQRGALGWKFWPVTNATGQGPSPTASPTPAPTADNSLPDSADSGLAVVDEIPNLNLLDAIVGGVVSAYFGP